MKISVLVPIYGVEKYIRQCIDSIVGNTYGDLEIILLDDGSNDRSGEIADEYAKKDLRIRVIHKKNEGYGATCNRGIDEAQGDYIAIIEPDDFIEPIYFETLAVLAEKFSPDVVKGKFREIITNKQDKPREVRWPDTKIPVNRPFNITECGVFLACHPSIWTCLYRAKFLKDNFIRFQEIAGASWVDNLFQVRSLVLAKKIVYTPNVLYNYRVSDGNPSSDLKDYRIPYDRSKEIDNWLKENCFLSPEIICNIKKREVSYIKIVIAANSEDENDLLQCVKRWVNELVANREVSMLLSEHEIKFLKKVRCHPKLQRLILRTKNIIRKYIRVRIKSNNFYLSIGGVEFFNLKNNKVA